MDSRYEPPLWLAVAISLMGKRYSRNAGMSSTIQQVKSRHAARLLSLPGVVSVGIGRAPDGTFAIVVGLVGPCPDTVREIPKTVEGYAVRVEIIGPVKAQ